jgi:ParB family chromosome partitioning protein
MSNSLAQRNRSLREATEFYKVDVATITFKVKQEFAAKEKAKEAKKAAPKPPAKTQAKVAKRAAA